MRQVAEKDQLTRGKQAGKPSADAPFLLRRADLNDRAVVPSGSWQEFAAASFIEQLGKGAKDFPCVLGVKGFAADTLRFIFAEGEDPAVQIAAALRRYLREFRDYGSRYTSLVVFLPPRAGAGLMTRDYEQQFWQLLGRLRDLDGRPWPQEIPVDPQSACWEFCFNEEPMFVVCNSPAHVRRRSRRSNTLNITFQPRWVFEGLEPETQAGQQIRKLIRGKLAAYDAVPPHPALGFYGAEGNHEWQQYFLADDNDSTPQRCPLARHLIVDRNTDHPTTTFQGEPVSENTGEARRPCVERGAPVSMERAVLGLLPTTGSVEVQRDSPGRVHSEHDHPTDETLYILDGFITFHLADQDLHCGPGDRLLLPAGTRHSSTAGPAGCVYVIALQMTKEGL